MAIQGFWVAVSLRGVCSVIVFDIQGLWSRVFSSIHSAI